MKIPFSAYDFFGTLAAGFVALATVDFAFDGGWLLESELTPVLGVVWIVLAYTIGHIIAHVSSVFLEHGVLRRGLGSPETHMFAGNRAGGIWPRLFPGNFQPLPEDTQQRVRARAAEEGVACSGRGFFFHCHAIVKRDPATRERLGSFLNMYGFCRNMCMAGLLAVPILLIGSVREFNVDSWWSSIEKPQLWAAVGALGVSVGMFYRYLKFFRHYTLEVFTTYAVPGA